MDFPASWFDDEVRDGFYVSSIVKREWAARMEVLNEIATVCERHHLRWFAGFGTMLGAIRHHGFVPWDDDMDIFMPADDYNELLRYVPLEFPDDYKVTDERNPGQHSYIGVIGARYNIEEAERLSKQFHDFPYPPGVDIFRLDYISDNEEDEKWRDSCLHNVVYTIVQLQQHGEDILGATSVDVDHVTLNDLQEFRDCEWMETANNGLSATTESTGHQFNGEDPILDQLFLLYEGLASYFRPEEASRIAFLADWIQDENRNVYPKDILNHLIKVPFENMEVVVPEDYKDCLTMLYGPNYMEFVKAASSHTYPSFREIQKEALIQSGYPDSNPLEYSFDEADIKERPQDGNTPKQIVRQLFTVLEKMHQNLPQINQPQNGNLILEVLESCQNGAIQIGNCIEKARSEELTDHLFIQDYAEIAYQLYDKAVNGGMLPTEEDLKSFDSALQAMKKAVEKLFLNRREVMFVPYTARKWRAMESLWRACKEDPNCDVFVVPAPTYEKDISNIIRPEQHYDLDQYPEEVHAISYQEYDTGNRHPDYIFIQNPYDQYNYVNVVEMSMYSRFLYGLTDHLIYIPWFVTCEFGMDSPDDVAAMDFYVKTPGVVRSDLTIVQSETIADTYRQVLTQFAGYKTKEVWDRKIQGWGSPLQDGEGTASPLWKKVLAYFRDQDGSDSGNER